MKTKSVGFEAVKTLLQRLECNLIDFQLLIKKDLRFQNYKNIHKDYSDYFHKQLSVSNNRENRFIQKGAKKNY